jgi:hypothetical protein
VAFQRLVKPLEQEPTGGPIVVKRDQDDDSVVRAGGS